MNTPITHRPAEVSGLARPSADPESGLLVQGRRATDELLDELSKALAERLNALVAALDI